MHKTKLTPPS